MSQIRPKILVRYGRINQPIRVPIYDLTVDSINTVLTADTASGSSTLTVKNITGFAVNQVLIIGEPGNEGAEIIKTHASSAPSGSTITLASNTVFPHSSSTTIRVINYDQVEYSTATTTTGSKTVLTTSSLVADSLTTDYNDTAASTGYYFARFKNSITSGFSSYSDPAPVTGYALTSARFIIDSALSEINKKTNEILSDEFAFQQINNCQMEVLRELKRWSFMQVFDYIAGDTATGGWRFALPANCDDQNTIKSIYNIRIGKNSNLTWVDKAKWNQLLQDVAYTTLANSIALNDVTITLTDSSDFENTGTVRIGANSYTYTANNRTTGVLTITASTTTNTAGAYVFQGASFGNPQYYTVFGGYVYHYPVISSDYNQRNYIMDYYSSLTPIVSDADTVVIPDTTVINYYLQWKFMKKINGGAENDASLAAFGNYIQRRNTLKNKETINRTFTLKPRFQDFRRRMQGEQGDTELERVGNFLDF